MALSDLDQTQNYYFTQTFESPLECYGLTHSALGHLAVVLSKRKRGFLLPPCPLQFDSVTGVFEPSPKRVWCNYVKKSFKSLTSATLLGLYKKMKQAVLSYFFLLQTFFIREALL